MKPKILIYINSHVAYHLDKSSIKKYLNNQLGHKSWIGFGDVLMPEELKQNPEYLTENFFHGVSAHQYTMIKNGGTFINPMLYGLNSDFNMWNDILHEESDFFQEVMFIDVPYEMYEQVADEDEYLIDEEGYDHMTNMITNIVERIKATYYHRDEQVH